MQSLQLIEKKKKNKRKNYFALLKKNYRFFLLSEPHIFAIYQRFITQQISRISTFLL